jgi:hypothetical protein
MALNGTMEKQMRITRPFKCVWIVRDDTETVGTYTTRREARAACRLADNLAVYRAYIQLSPPTKVH